MGKMPFSYRIALAQMCGDKKTEIAIMKECFESITHELTGVATSHDMSDLPFVVATMKVTANALMNYLDENGRSLVDKIASSITCITVDMDELERQAGGAKDGEAEER